MGCRQQGRQKNSAENEKVGKIEDSLGLKQYDCSFFEGILSRLSNSSSPTQFLDYFQKFTKLPFSDAVKSHLISLYSKDSKFLFNDFRVFCILMSKSSEQEKGESLWYIYDDTLKETLFNTQIKEMLSSIIRTSVLFSVSLAVQSLPTDEKLKAWEIYLKERQESLEIKLIKHFTSNQETVTKDEFLLRLNDRPEGLVTSTLGIRDQLERTQVIPNKFANPFKKMKITKLTS